MPNATVLQQKQEVVNELVRKMRTAGAGVLVDYRGITVEADTALRATLRKNNIEYAVVKNTLVRRAADEVGFSELDPYLHGTTALAMHMTDEILPAKLLAEYARSNPKFMQIKAGFVSGKVIDAQGVDNLSNLPPREILLAMVVGALQAPISGLARAIDSIANQQSPAAEAPVEA